MDLALWIVAGLLAAIYVLGGGGKLIVPKERMAAAAAAAAWTEDFSAAQVKGIGVLEVLGGVGLILPAVLDIAPVLVPTAAIGLATIMVGAALTRLRRNERKLMLLDLGYLTLCGFVAWGRLILEPFTG